MVSCARTHAYRKQVSHRKIESAEGEKQTMKRIVLLLLALAMLLSMGACGNAGQAAPTEAEQTPAPVSESPEEAATPESAEAAAPEAAAPEAAEDAAAAEETAAESTEAQQHSRILVVYFSRTGEQYGVGVIEKGNTAIVAEMIAEGTGADVYEILPADDHYPLTYKELTDVGLQEQNEGARPAIAGTLPDLSGYDTVFIGAPVWWGDWPMICYTFFESEPMSGKTLLPFSTHAGSGLSGFDRRLAAVYPECSVGKGLAVSGADAQNNPEQVNTSVNRWLAELGFNA